MNWKAFLTGILFLLDAFLEFGGSSSYVYYAPGVMFLAAGFLENEYGGKIFGFLTWICLIIGLVMFVSGMLGINLFS